MNSFVCKSAAKYLWLQLSYGSRTDKKRLAAIKEAVGIAPASEH